MKREEILDPHIQHVIDTGENYPPLADIKVLPEYQATLVAMDEFAKQQAAEFAEWVYKKYFRVHHQVTNTDYWEEYGVSEKRYATSELYTLFTSNQ